MADYFALAAKIRGEAPPTAAVLDGRRKRRLTRKAKSRHDSQSGRHGSGSREKKRSGAASRKARSPSREDPTMKRRQSRKARAASLRNLRKARAARRASETPRRKRRRARAHTKTVRRRARRSAAPRRRTRRRARRRAAEAPKRRRRRAAPRRRRRRARRRVRETPKRRRRRTTHRRRRAAPRRRRRARARDIIERRGGHHRWHLKRGRKGRFTHAYENPIGNPMLEAAENPMGAAEWFIGGGSVLLGAVGANITDRFLATHALQMIASPFNPSGGNTATTDATKAATDPNGNIIYMDVPDTGSPTMWNPYTTLFNGTAIAAPMGVKRWLGAAGWIILPSVAGIPLSMKGWAKTAAFFNFLGFGAFVNTGIKSVSDLLAFVLKNTSFGKRVYDVELRAQAQKRADGSTQYLPSTGLGRVGGCGGDCGCNKCKASKASQQANQQAQQQPPAPPPPPANIPQSVPIPQQVAPPPSPVPVPVQPGGKPTQVPVPVQPPNPFAAGIRGLPPKPPPFIGVRAWGHREDVAAE